MQKQVVVALGAVLLAVLAWWLLRADPEDRVREAHLNLVDAVSKSAENEDGLSVLQLRSLEMMFAEEVVVSGEARGFSQAYTPQEIVSLIVQIRVAFESIELHLSEIRVELPASDSAIATFSVELEGIANTGEQVFEVRSVESRMRYLDGDWLFSEFFLGEAMSVPVPPR